LAWIGYVVRWLVWLVGAARRRLGRVAPWVSFLIEATPAEPEPPRRALWRRLLVRRPPPSLASLRRQLRAVASDPRVRGVVVHLRPVALTAAQGQALAELLTEVREAGKRVVCWAPSYQRATYPVACAADEILLPVGGSIDALGVDRGYLFLAEALARVGVQADLVQITPYKTAGDVLSKARMTPEAREMAEWLADAAFADLVEAVRCRGLDEAAARRLIDGSPYTDQQALAAGAVDALVSEEELPARLGGAVQPFGGVAGRLRRPPPGPPGPFVGLIRVEGMIVDGRSRRAPWRPPIRFPIMGDDQAGDLTVVQQARRLASDRRCAAAVLWVDSGGGSATASEAMAAALQALASRKPLVAAMGSVAASGGYYVVTPARRVFARPGTITGSIGVIGGKLVAGGLLDRLLFNREVVARGARATIGRWERPYSDEERRLVRASIERSYEVFLQRVADARGCSPREVDAVGGGRVWTGRQALERGLVDELGGLDRAIAEARRLAGLRDDAPVREARDGRGESVPPAAAALAPLEHALAAVVALNQATCWWLCPWIFEE
jgi:protease-4